MEVNSATITITTSSVNAKQDQLGLDRFCAAVEALAVLHLNQSNVTVELDIKRSRLARIRAPGYDITEGDRALADKFPPASSELSGVGGRSITEEIRPEPPMDRHGG